MHVLIADSLQRFLAQENVPEDITVALYSANDEPSGDFAGIVPDITRRVSAAELERLPALRVIANYGAGYDNIDLVAARNRGITVTNTPGVLTEATAELTWALILAVTRRIGEGERLVRAGKWQGWAPTHMLGSGLTGKTLGIIGAGRIGREVGRRAPAFGMRVLYSNRSSKPEWEQQCAAQRVETGELLAQADVITVHVALATGTRHMIAAPELSALKRSAFLVNTSRGPVVDEQALIEALQAGQLRGAGLDVYEREPGLPAALLTMENVVLLPHLGSATEEARLAMWKLAWKNLNAALRGEPVPNPVT
jgi:glyoxylate reductase